MGLNPLRPHEATLASLAGDWGRPLAPGQVAALLEFCRLLLTWNRRINLTASRSIEDLAGEHLGDAFAMDRLVPPSSRVVDIGAGGGLPAIPFAILRPDCALTLVEPRARRGAFLRAAIREQRRPDIAILDCRDEALPPGGYTVASSRATFPPLEWLARGARLVAPQGRVLVFAASRQAVPDDPGRTLSADVAYRTHRGHSRWAAAYCST